MFTLAPKNNIACIFTPGLHPSTFSSVPVTSRATVHKRKTRLAKSTSLSRLPVLPDLPSHSIQEPKLAPAPSTSRTTSLRLQSFTFCKVLPADASIRHKLKTRTPPNFLEDEDYDHSDVTDRQALNIVSPPLLTPVPLDNDAPDSLFQSPPPFLLSPTSSALPPPHPYDAAKLLQEVSKKLETLFSPTILPNKDQTTQDEPTSFSDPAVLPSADKLIPSCLNKSSDAVPFPSADPLDKTCHSPSPHDSEKFANTINSAVFITVLLHPILKTDSFAAKLLTDITLALDVFLTGPFSLMLTPSGDLAVTVSSYDDADTLSSHDSLLSIPITAVTMTKPYSHHNVLFRPTHAQERMHLDVAPGCTSHPKLLHSPQPSHIGQPSRTGERATNTPAISRQLFADPLPQSIFRSSDSSQASITVPTLQTTLMDNSTVPAYYLQQMETASIPLHIYKPKQCNNCFRYAHLAKQCRSSSSCAFCAGPEHPDNRCPSQTCFLPPKCSNCAGAHTATSSSCPAHRLQIELLKYKFEHNVSFATAKQFVHPRGLSYAAAVRRLEVNATHSRILRQQNHASHNVQTTTNHYAYPSKHSYADALRKPPLLPSPVFPTPPSPNFLMPQPSIGQQDIDLPTIQTLLITLTELCSKLFSPVPQLGQVKDASSLPLHLTTTNS